MLSSGELLWPADLFRAQKAGAFHVSDELPGGVICRTIVRPELFGSILQTNRQADSNPGELTAVERDKLWKMFVAIGNCWGTNNYDSLGLKSSWLEFIEVKTSTAPSYLAEYVNALEVIDEWLSLYGPNENEAFERLLVHHGIKTDPPTTRLSHTKTYVVDEFIKVWVVAGGFRAFGGGFHAKNYNGFIRGTRYNISERVRSYKPKGLK